MYGNVTLDRDVTVPEGDRLVINSGSVLTINSGKTLTNEGTINKNGGTIDGTVSGTGTVNP
jgi:hypothetical protein